MSHRPDVNLVVLGVSAQPLDENDLALVIHCHNESVRVALDVEYHAIAAHDAGRCVTPRYGGGPTPLRILHFMKPRIQCRLDGFLVRATPKGIDQIPSPLTGNCPHHNPTLTNPLSP